MIGREVGTGTFGKCFLATDLKYSDEVVVKVVRKIKRYVKSAVIEADLLRDVTKKQREDRVGHCVKLYDHFHFDGYYCLVCEPLGMSLYDFMKKNDYRGIDYNINHTFRDTKVLTLQKMLSSPSGFSLIHVREFARQMLQAINFLKGMNMIHTDLKLENILFVNGRYALRNPDQKFRSSDSASGRVTHSQNGSHDCYSYPFEQDGDYSDGNREKESNEGGDGGEKHARRQKIDDIDVNRDMGRNNTEHDSTSKRRDSEESRAKSSRVTQLMVPLNLTIKVIDFGGATYDDEDKSTIVNTRQVLATRYHSTNIV